MPDFEVTTLPVDEYPLWNAFVQSAPRGTFFHRSEWADLIALGTERPFRILTCRRGNDMLAGVVLFENAKWGLIMATPVPLFPFNGPLVGPPDDAGEHRVVARSLQYSDGIARFMDQHYDYWILDTGYGFHDIRSFQWAGCRSEPVYTYQKKLRTDAGLQTTYNQGLRRKIREAEARGMVVREADYAEKFLDLYHRSYKRHDLHPPVERKVIERILKMIIKLDQVRLFVAELDNEIVAGRVVLVDQHSIYDLLAGSDDPSGLGATFIVHTLLVRYAGTHDMFDFMGAGHPGIEQFKRGFGGRLELGFRITGKSKFPLSLLIRLRNANLTRRRQL